MEDFNNAGLPDSHQGSQQYRLSLNMPFLKNFIGWATFRAVMDIIGGALACLGIITAAFGVPQIISGIKLLNAVDETKRYMASNEVQNMEQSFYNLHKHFKMSGISIIVKIIFYVVFIILYGVMIFYMVQNMPDIFRDIPTGYTY